MNDRPHLRLTTELPETPIKKSRYKPRPPREYKFRINGFTIEPGAVERRLSKVRWVVDIGVTTRGQKEDRRLVAFVVLEKGRLLRDIELDLENMANSHLPAYARPKAYSQVDSLPRDLLGKLKRRTLASGSFDGRIFQRLSGQYKGQCGRGVTISIRNPINEVHFEGVVAFPVMNRRHGDPVGKVRTNEARVIVSHKTSTSNIDPGMRVTFLFKGPLSAEAKKLNPGDRICVTGKITTKFSGRQFIATSFVRVDDKVQRTDLTSTDRVIEQLL